MSVRENDRAAPVAVYPFELLLLGIACMSVASVALLSMGWFEPLRGLALGTLFSLAAARFWRLSLCRHDPRLRASFWAILLIAFICRANPYLFILGGQDEGLYVNMAAHFQRGGNPFLTDGVRQRTRLFGATKTYDGINHYNHIMRRKGKYEGTHVPGVYIADLGQSKYVFQFYHLHPLWMAIAGRILGDHNRVWSLVLFGLLSITALSLLAFEISGGSRSASILTGLFLAVHPLHAFFSKFPVTEIVALAFVAGGFYSLARYYRLGQEGRFESFYLFLSAGLFFCFFLTRISGFMYLPLFWAMGVTALLSPRGRSHLVWYVLAVFGLFALSVAYGLHFSFPYSLDVYESSFQRILGSQWQQRLYVLITAVAMSTAVIGTLSRNQKDRILRLMSKVSMVVPYAIVIIIAVGCYNAYQLGFTPKYAGNAVARHWSMAGHRWDSIPFSALYVAVAYLSPIGFLLFLAGMLRFKRRRDPPRIFLMLFLLFGWYYSIVMQKFVPYQYYYARYLLIETVPFAILLASLELGKLVERRGAARVTALCLAAAMASYFLYFTVPQFSGREAAGAAQSLEQVSAVVRDGDLLLFHKGHIRFPMEIKTALSIYYDRDILEVESPEDIVGGIRDLLQVGYRNGDVFFLTGRPEARKYLSLVNTIAYSQGVFEHVPRIPRRFFFLRTTLFLYRVDKSKLRSDAVFPGVSPADLQGFYTDRVWTNGKARITNFRLPVRPGQRYLVIQTYGWHPYLKNPKQLGLSIRSGNRRLAYSHRNGKTLYFTLPRGMRLISELEIDSSTFVPSKLGMNRDQRTLGLDIRAIRLE